MERMAGFAVAVRTLLFLAGLVFLLVVLSQGIRRRSTNRILASTAGLILVIGTVWIGYWKYYQCVFSVPERIRIVGHVKDKSNAYLNDYVVLLFRDNVEVAEYRTVTGKFSGDKSDKENKGYFEFDLPNTDRLTRCSMRANFNQGSPGRKFWQLRDRTIYLWHNFSEIEPGTQLPITMEDKKKKYVLEVLPSSQDNLPREISLYPTFLDQNGKAAISAPIVIYTMQGGLPVESNTNYFVPAGKGPEGVEVQNAWVIADSNGSFDDRGTPIMDHNSVDINNCTGTSAITIPIRKSFSFMREVQFETPGDPGYDLGMVAFRANPSLGFTNGQIVTEERIVDVDVHPGEHKVYKLIWMEVWETGAIEIDLGDRIKTLPYRASNTVFERQESHDVDCPP